MNRIICIFALFLTLVAATAPHPFDTWPLPWPAWSFVDFAHHPGQSATRYVTGPAPDFSTSSAAYDRAIAPVVVPLDNPAKARLLEALRRDNGLPQWDGASGVVTNRSRKPGTPAPGPDLLMLVTAGGARYLLLTLEYGAVLQDTLVYRVEAKDTRFTPLFTVEGAVGGAWRSAAGLVLTFIRVTGGYVAQVVLEAGSGRLRPLFRLGMELTIGTPAGTWHPVLRSIFLPRHKPAMVPLAPGRTAPAAVVAEDRPGKIVVAAVDWPDPAGSAVPGGHAFFKGCSYRMFWMDRGLTRRLR